MTIKALEEQKQKMLCFSPLSVSSDGWRSVHIVMDAHTDLGMIQDGERVHEIPVLDHGNQGTISS